MERYDGPVMASRTWKHAAVCKGISLIIPLPQLYINYHPARATGCASSFLDPNPTEDFPFSLDDIITAVQSRHARACGVVHGGGGDQGTFAVTIPRSESPCVDAESWRF